MRQYKKVRCIVCGKEFERRGGKQRRCAECQALYRKELEAQYQRELAESTQIKRRGIGQQSVGRKR